MAKQQVNAKNFGKAGIDVLIGMVALALGGLTASQADNIKKTWGPLAASLVAIGFSLKASNQRLQWALIIVAAAHAGKAMKSYTEGKTGFWSLINTYTPSLAGRGAIGRGAMGRLGNPEIVNALGEIHQAASPSMSAAAALGYN